MTGKFLDNAYTVDPASGARGLYDAWAASYDAEIAENGYATPRRCAAALARYASDTAGAVLDFGCGTGLSGLALRAAGFSRIDGVDLSPEMLAQAAEKGCYQSLAPIADDIPLPNGPHAAVAAVGVIGPGHAPPETLDRLLAHLDPGGLMVFSLNDATREDPAFEARLTAQIDTGLARLLLREHGPHLPGRGLNATVYVIEKT